MRTARCNYGHQPLRLPDRRARRKGVDFIDSSAAAGKPFFLELATFAPHAPYMPAPRDATTSRGCGPAAAQLRRAADATRRAGSPATPPLTPRRLAQIDQAFRRARRSVQAVDEMIGRIEAALAANGLADDTYIVFSSDNGLHTGEYRLMPGKLTAFDTDIHVPLVVPGPGVPPATHKRDRREHRPGQDVRPDRRHQHAGDGHSLVPLLGGMTPSNWRNAVLDRAPRSGAATRPRLPAAPQRQPDHLRGDAHHALPVRRVRATASASSTTSRTDPFELHNLARRSRAAALQLHPNCSRSSAATAGGSAGRRRTCSRSGG